MTVLRLTYDGNTAVDIRPSDVVEITAESRYSSDPEVVVEVDAGVRDNYRYVADSAKFVDRDSDSDVPLQ
jgi:hypothetical protein